MVEGVLARSGGGCSSGRDGGRAAGGTRGVLVDVERTSDDSSVATVRLAAPAECRAERRLRRLGGR